MHTRALLTCNTLFFGVLCTLLFLILLLFTPGFVHAQGIHLSDTDSVRVWVFENRVFSKLSVGVYEGTAVVLSEQDTLFYLKADERPLSLSRRGQKIEIDDKPDNAVKILQVHAVGTSLLWAGQAGSPRVFLRGNLQLDTKSKSNSLRLINEVSLEDYVTSVIAGEMPFLEQEALKTQAVIARTYALWNMALAKKGDYDVTDHTASQVYIGEPVTKPWVRAAAEATAGEVLTWSGRLILSAYFSTSGGTTTGNETVWKGKPLPYLRPIDDGDASSDSPHFEWRFAANRKQIYQLFKSAYPRNETGLSVLEKDESGRVIKILVGTRPMSGQEFRLAIIRQFGAKSLKSTLFDISFSPDSVVFSGRGMGHGVGLSQWGAYGLSRSGWSYVEILKFYYSGAEVSNIHHFQQNFIELAQ